MNQNDTPLGYELPLYRSTTESILMAGAPKGIIVLNATLAGFFIISLHFFYILILNVIIHVGAVFLTKHDDRFFDCLRVFMKQQDYYDT